MADSNMADSEDLTEDEISSVLTESSPGKSKLLSYCNAAIGCMICCLPVDLSSEPISSPAPDSDDMEYELGEIKAKALPGFDIACQNA